jgi:hypothetical protein
MTDDELHEYCLTEVNATRRERGLPEINLETLKQAFEIIDKLATAFESNTGEKL